MITFRELGKGYTALSKFCGFMNMVPPVTNKTFDELQKSVANIYIKVAQENMMSAADEIRKEELKEKFQPGSVADTTTSADGTWQRRGFASLNGAVTIVGNKTGKCIEFRVKSKHCKSCKYWKYCQGTKAYDDYVSQHTCPENFVGSSGAMEAKGVVECFTNSITINKLRYAVYKGDGDTKSYSDVLAADPYPGLIVKKAECLGHVQKRVGSRLRKLKSTFKVNFPDGKSLGGKGRLTNELVNRLQNYYDIAIRSCTTVPEMKRAIGAALYHCSEANSSEGRHQFCPKSKDSWCKYYASKFKKGTPYVEKLGFPVECRKKIEPIFRDLSSDDLLNKCLHGNTQNKQ